MPLISNAPTTFYLDRINNPLSLDLPFYTIFTTTNQGAMENYNYFKNTGHSTFMTQNLDSLEISCQGEQMMVGQINRICEIAFVPNNPVKGDSVLLITFEGVLSIKTSLCEMEYKAATDVWTAFQVANCTVEGTNNQILRLSINDENNDGYGPMDTTYRVRVYGIDFNGTTSSTADEFVNCSVGVSIRDSSGSYSVEESKVYFSVVKPLGIDTESIALNEISYSY